MSYAVIALRHWLAATLPDPREDRGASLVEYALLVALIMVVCVIAVTILGTTVSKNFSSSGEGW